MQKLVVSKKKELSMPIHITVDKAVTWGADKWLSYQNASDERKAQILKVTKYNMLVNGFNTSSVLLAVALAAAVVFAYTMAVTLGAIALFIRNVTEKELKEYASPELLQAGMNVLGMGHPLLKKIGAREVAGWEENEVTIVHAVWKNTAPLPFIRG
jgi:hypothetical protein